jgi:four helix bundle protein
MEKCDLKLRTKSFALRIIRMADAIVPTSSGRIISRQVLRSGTSIGANYREAFRARSRAEFIAKCGDALREIEETTYWLELLEEARLVVPGDLQPLRLECSELTAIFVTIVKRSRAAKHEAP